MQKIEKIIYASLLPFVLAMLLAWAGLDIGQTLFQSLALLLLVFLTGSRFGSIQVASARTLDFYIVLGLLIWALLAWFVPYRLSIIMLLLGFAVLFGLEFRRLENNIFKQYKRTSWIFVSILGVLHLAVFFITGSP